MVEEIVIQKKDLWKYSTFILLAIVLIGGGILIFGNNSTTGEVVSGNSTSGAINLNVFLSNPSLYPSIGPKDAENVVIEFFDYQCPFCAIVSGYPSWVSTYADKYLDIIATSQKLQKMAEDGKIRLIYVQMSFLGQESVYAAEAALCANEQGNFWEMQKAIFTAHDSKENNGKYSKANLEIIAKGIAGLDTAKFNTCLDNDKELSNVQTIAAAAKSAGVTGTPTFYVNGQKMSASWASIQAALK